LLSSHIPLRRAYRWIANASWRENYKSIKRSTIKSLMGSAVLGDAYRIYLATQRDGIDYHLPNGPKNLM